MKRVQHALLLLSSLWSCQPSQPEEVQPATIHAFMQEVTDRMVHDIFSPPVVSRVYAYVSTAGYEAYRPGHPELLT
ncbi:MAG: phosphatidic acid phosphatase, partial [Schleiferiaceae bacterium]